MEDNKNHKQKTLKGTVFIPTWDNQPPELVPVIKLNGKPILTKENITCIIAKEGAGKSSAMEAITSACINSDSDNLGFTSSAERVLYIDFERTKNDVWKSFRRVMIRAKIEKPNEVETQKIASLRSFSTASQRKEEIEDLIIEHKPELLLLDGIGDLVDDTNSLEQVIEVKNWVRYITDSHNLSIITTLHPNKGSNNPRGHIGSEMLRECEGVLLIRVNDDETRTITTDFEHGKGRNSGKAEASFVWSSEKLSFISTQTVVKKEKPKTKKPFPSDLSNELWEKVLTIVFEDKTALMRSELLLKMDLALNKVVGKSFTQEFFRLSITYLCDDINFLGAEGTPGTRNYQYKFIHRKAG